jgi:hypothetical protein
MDTITSFEPVEQPGDVFLLPAYCPIAGLGVLPMHSMLIRGAQPTLIDTGPRATSAAFVERLGTLIDLKDLRWIWITHADPDHVGALAPVLERAPSARVVTTFLGLGKLGLLGLVPPERAYLLNPGQRLDIGDRELVGLRPPIYDAPETLAAFDARTRSLFAADAFGALLDAPAADAGEIAAPALRSGVLTWASIDAPWLEHMPERALASVLADVRQLGVSHIYSAHLPPAHHQGDSLAALLLAACGRKPFVGADQRALDGSPPAPRAALDTPEMFSGQREGGRIAPPGPI